MDLQATKIELAQMILQTESAELLRSIQKLFKKEEKDTWDQLSEEQRNGIEIGYQQMLDDDTVSYDDIKRELFTKK